ncbi:molybdate ABC transporter substrate-binding protein [Tessaracoccus sp. ZS01]|uniref:molybdate ABC transporter substrate-binding protein n=1 Tax=Tessaracoccus sp. ZS01 TaxID=1906324 RepID=UPI00096C91A8|nr:molybdate ABC transporter substrate-binding protein [Tessaracoccus sp. ZS01]MCG6567330.1 molybdate ABC transporter substrate-binding protein [Tessaracoccus sp. ZS01]OMG57286.1 molybdate ABC transporter substrate-binding protein [Tessaracoccus sp. ZS01]
MRWVLGLALAASALTGCAPTSGGPLRVFAAASLHQVLPQLEPEADYSFDGSSGLVDQIAGGARADVFASADRNTMDRAVREGLIAGEPVMFATNHLVLVVPTGNPGGVTGFDASLDGVKLVVCAEEVPCGAASRRLADSNGVALSPVSEETKVTDVLGKVASGEADAGLVYATDAATSEAVEILPVPGAEQDPTTYWVAVLKGAARPEAARAYAERLAGQWGAQLQGFGFGSPS